MTEAGQAEIRRLSALHGVRVSSLTGDCFMQAPFWKRTGSEAARLEAEFLAVADACAALHVSLIVVPLVDNGRLDDAAQENALVTFLTAHARRFQDHGVRVAFESDFPADELSRLIARFDSGAVGINYDIGNSAALGFDPADELGTYGDRVIGVHVKDRLLGGTTVPFGTGSADFEAAFRALTRSGYDGTYILQSARAANGDHAGALKRYGEMTGDLLLRHAP
jgi:L-ribulose-5-phosphate 3-epimerase